MWAGLKHEEDDAEKVYSGVPVMILAESDVEVAKLAYGSTYSQKGAISLGAGLAVGFISPSPKRDYIAHLKKELDNARETLDRNAKKNGDKTSIIKGTNFERPSALASHSLGRGIHARW